VEKYANSRAPSILSVFTYSAPTVQPKPPVHPQVSNPVIEKPSDTCSNIEHENIQSSLSFLFKALDQTRLEQKQLKKQIEKMMETTFEGHGLKNIGMSQPSLETIHEESKFLE
jgi:hypothetical protein